MVLLPHQEGRRFGDRDHGEGCVHYKGRRAEHLTKSWRNAKAKARNTKRIRVYDLRHLAASEMLAAGADLQYVPEILGHASLDMILSVYQHTSTALRRDVISRLGNPLPADQKIK
ncbi:MAG: tyrosine-type recombinase/integrase [Proteobacteria bacterium]|nr:tyrosine-type recombinase/integrase [Pseudomonadota bacterium]